MFEVSAKYKKYCSEECQREMKGERDKRYIREQRMMDERPKPTKKFGDYLLTLKAEGKDYAEEQRKQTIEMYARIVI